MKRLQVITVMFLAVLALFSVIPNLAGAAGTTIGPDAYGYFATGPDVNGNYATDAATYSFVNISPTGPNPGTGTPVLPNVDNDFISAPIGFNFNFYGTTYNTAFISTNGLITFGIGNGTGEQTNQAFTGTVTPDYPMVGNLWDDWTTADLFSIGSGKNQRIYGDAVYYQTLDDKFIVQWNDVLHTGAIGNNPATFEAILYQNGDIKFQYNDVVVGINAFNNGASATVGIRAAGSTTTGSSTYGYDLQWSCDQANAVNNNTAILFTKTNPNPPPTSVAYAYAFTYNYSAENGYTVGDSYTGTVYAAPENAPISGGGYGVGAAGTRYEGTEAEGLWNQVDVASYFDAESGKSFPANGNLFATRGTAGLGNEDGYIINNSLGISDYYFGGPNHHEADVVAYAYGFTYNYAAPESDSYAGTVYAAPENAPTGVGYTVGAAGTRYEGTVAEGLWNKVDVASYFDAESGRTFTAGNASYPLFVTTATGLGNEDGHIINTGFTDYHFGTTAHLEADVVAYAYGFTASYSGGDSFTGTVYAAPEYNFTTAINAEQNQTVTYTIATGSRVAEGLVAEGLWGQVQVASYTDGESGNTYNGAKLFVTPGTGANYLGSESGYIIKAGIDDFRFGNFGAFYEADLVGLYTYKFTFGCGDYYTGIVYASQDGLYRVGDSFNKIAKDENGSTASKYLITGVSYVEDTSYGRVTVDKYYDSEMKKFYTPIFVFNDKGGYLGNEYGFINITTYPTNINWNVDNLANPSLPTTSPSLPSGTMKFYFGGGYWEADVKSDNATK